MREIWVSISEFPRYQISNLGNAKGARGLILKPCLFGRGQGYLGICIYVGNYKSKVKSIHRFVAKAFIPNPNNYPEVNHKDGNKLNNKSTNLEWMTQRQNSDHAIRTGLIAVGEMSSMAKLKNHEVINIRRIKKNNPKTSNNELAKKYKVHNGTISRILNNKQWVHLV